jgi:hypothetical protein
MSPWMFLFDWCVVAGCGAEPEELCTEQSVSIYSSSRKGKEKWSWWCIARIRSAYAAC